MKTVVAGMALVTSLVFAASFLADAAFAQRRQRVPRSYGPVTPYSYSSSQPSRFTPEEQRIIDQITRNGRASGY